MSNENEEKPFMEKFKDSMKDRRYKLADDGSVVLDIASENKEDLFELEIISKDIEEKTKELNNIFDSLEETFRKKLNIGVGAWCDEILSPMENDRYGYKFGYCRVGKAWRLVCRKINLDNISDNENGYYGIITPINCMPRKVRIEASKLIPELIQKLKDKSLSFKNTIATAVNSLEDINKKINETHTNSD